MAWGDITTIIDQWNCNCNVGVPAEQFPTHQPKQNKTSYSYYLLCTNCTTLMYINVINIMYRYRMSLAYCNTEWKMLIFDFDTIFWCQTSNFRQNGWHHLICLAFLSWNQILLLNMSWLPNHASSPPLYFHMPLPKIVLLLCSDFCLNTYFPDNLASHLPIFIKSRTWWYVTAYLHALIQLYILLHLPVVFCIGILLRLCVSSGFSCTCLSPAKYLWFEPFVGFTDILAIRVVFTWTSCWFSQYPYQPHKHVNLSPLW